MLNYSNRHCIDLLWTKNFPIRRFTAFKSFQNTLLISIDSTQCWCISPRVLIGVFRFRCAINFAEAFWLPEVSFRIALNKREKSFHCKVWLRKWKQNLTAFVQNFFSKKVK